MRQVAIDLLTARGSAAAALALTLGIALGGCGSSASSGAVKHASQSTSTPAYVTEPPTHQQLLVNRGAQLIVSDGCASCHLPKTPLPGIPSFASFAGNEVTLLDGQRTLVDERFLRESLTDPRATLLEGYDPAPMLAALRRLHLAHHPAQVAALAAFIEQIGPEPE